MKSLISILIFTLNITFLLGNNNSYTLNFNPEAYTINSFNYENKEYKVRCFENIIYVKNPVDTMYQVLNIYVPEEYYHNKKIRNYSKKSAPIFLPNGIGGYMPSKPLTLLNKKTRNNRGPEPNDNEAENNISALQYALTQGFVVVSPGARGRTLKNNEGVYTGKAPAGLIDLKAAVRYLRYNGDKIPGDKNLIISNGTSAGGAMSSLLGATGNHPDYKPYLEEIGAANMPDNIFAVSAFCPITILNHADGAYEWQFNGINEYTARGRGKSSNTAQSLTEEQILISNQLKALFPIYLNSLNLKDKKGNILTLDEQGNGSFKRFVKSFVLDSAQKEINNGTDLSSLSWLTIKDNKAVDMSFEGYVKYMKRMKTPPAFDALDLKSPENDLFGTPSINAQHFTVYSFDHSSVKSTIADSELIKMMNPMNYIENNNSMSAHNWRIRHGSIDSDTSIAIGIILSTKLRNNGFNVDYELAWGKPHSGDYNVEDLFNWIEKTINKR